MTGRMKTLIFGAALVVFLVGAALLYPWLRDSVTPQQLAPPPSGAESPPDTAIGPDVETEPGTVEQESDSRIKAPDFTVLDADGNDVRLSDFEGMPVVLNFWASWCPPCKSEMPDFDLVYAELGTQVQFMMVDLVDGSRETVEKGVAFVEEQGFSFPIYFDTTGEAAGLYGVRSIPTTLFIDKDGYLITGAQGAIDEALLRKGIGMIS